MNCQVQSNFIKMNNQFLQIDDWFHQGEGFNQVSEVHQEDEFNDGDQVHHVDELDQCCVMGFINIMNFFESMNFIHEMN